TVSDICGNLVASRSIPTDITLSVTGGTGTFTFGSGTLNVTPTGATTATIAHTTTPPSSAFNALNASGQGTFTISHGPAETVTLTATSGTGSATTMLTWNVGPAHHLGFTTQPVNTMAGAAIVPVVTIQDAGGNTVTGDDRNITLTLVAPAPPPGTGTLL